MEKSLMENFIFCAVSGWTFYVFIWTGGANHHTPSVVHALTIARVMLFGLAII